MHLTAWSFHRTSSFPIVKVIGESAEKEAELGLVSVAILLVKKAECFNGVPCQEEPVFPKTDSGSKISISFSILFKNEKDFIEFTKSCQDNGLV